MILTAPKMLKTKDGSIVPNSSLERTQTELLAKRLFIREMLHMFNGLKKSLKTEEGRVA